MNIQSKMPTTADEFLRWNEGREGKWDLVGGKVIDMMVRVSRLHAVVTANLLVALRDRLPSPSLVLASDFGVRTETSVRYPDVVVDGVSGEGSDLAAAAPVLVAEVLSRSSMPTDFGPKAQEYKTIATLRHYLVLSQAEPAVWLWSLGENGWSGPEVIEGVDAAVPLDGLGIMLPLEDLYAGIAATGK